MFNIHITIKILALTFVVLVCITNIVKARPKEGSQSNVKYDLCDEDLIELCQQCAKATKSPIVYPLCCEQKDGATSWCKDYLHYGIHV